MSKKSKYPVAQAPLILRAHRLMEAFAKSDDEREFYLDRVEGAIIYVDLDKAGDELDTFYSELDDNYDRYVLVPKLTFYEAKKIMEGFVHEKVYDIDTKEKLLDIIQSKEARENFLDFLYDHHSELEKWQQFYQERSRIRIIEWLRNRNFHFVFEEDLDIARNTMEKLKQTLFQARVPNDVQVARKMLVSKAKTYYSNEALNPRPKRGRPPKQVAKQEVETQVTVDLYTKVEPSVRPFLFTPEIANAAAVTFSAKFDTDEDLMGHRRTAALTGADAALESLNKKLASLRNMSASWLSGDEEATSGIGLSKNHDLAAPTKRTSRKQAPTHVAAPKAKEPAKKAPEPKKAAPAKKPVAKKPAATKATTTKAAAKKAPAKKPVAKKKAASSTASTTTKTRKTRIRPLPTSKGRKPAATKAKAAPKKKAPTKAATAKSAAPKKRTLTKLKRTK